MFFAKEIMFLAEEIMFFARANKVCLCEQIFIADILMR